MPGNPVLLLIQQGPGLPMINEARRFDHLLSLEQAFTVIYWDQRGCGRSLRRMKGPDSISLEAMMGDTVSLLDPSGTDSAGKTYVALAFSFWSRRSGRTPPHSARTPTANAGGGRNGRRRCRRRQRRLLLRARRSSPARQPARDPAARGHRPAAAPERGTVRHPGPLGYQLRRSHDQRNLRHPGARADRQPGALAPTIRPPTSYAPSAVSARHRPRCCPSSQP